MFLNFRTQIMFFSFLDFLPNFSLLRTLELAFLDFYFQEFTAAIIFLVPSFG